MQYASVAMVSYNVCLYRPYVIVAIKLNQLFIRSVVVANKLSFIAGQQSFIPSLVRLDPPSPFNGTDGSPSSFGSTCVLSRGLYVCNNTDNPLFDCSASNNSYYGWNDSNHISVTVEFANHFQSMNILVTFLISTSSNVSAPSIIRYSAVQNQLASTERNDPPPNLPEGPYQHSTVLPVSLDMFNRVDIMITPNSTFQWVAINRIIFCAAATEGL